MAVLLALMAAIAVASVCQAAPVSDPHHSLYRNAASGPLNNNHQSQFDVNLPGFLRVSGQHNYPYGYHPAQAIVPFQPQQQQQQRWLPSRFPTFGGFNPATAIPPLCLPCSNTSWPFFGNQRNSRQNRLLFPSFSLNAAGSPTNNQGSSSATDWMNWWTNPLGFLFPQNPVPQLPTLPFWTTIFCCNSTTNNSTRPATTTTTPATTAIPLTTATPSTTTVVPPTTTAVPPTTTAVPPTTTLVPPTTTAVPPTTTVVPPTTTVAPPTTTVAPPTTTVAPPTTTVAPPTTTVAPPTTTVAPPTTTVAPPTTTVAPPSTTPPPERSLESGTNSESLPTDTIPLSGIKLLMNLFPPSYISFLRR
ncbi:hepatitis A virus cellular receptor 1-like [Daphnia pulex]|uniref:hepatitis A virus cellular receptor 1-like n=1 Tax=Daphnia pulex TaxID=6669 RepID=UPI001EDEB10E|nr:hepatitis A virus cellular receptor 1-like [Daphnia pulex]